jgi:hypothetical protein
MVANNSPMTEIDYTGSHSEQNLEQKSRSTECCKADINNTVGRVCSHFESQFGFAFDLADTWFDSKLWDGHL